MNTKLQKFLTLLAIIILAGVMVIINLMNQPIEWQGEDQPVQIPIILHYQNPDLYQNDYLFTSLAHYSTYFFEGVSLLGLSLQGLSLLNIWGTVLSLFLFYLFYIFFCRQFSGSLATALLSALLIATGLMPALAVYTLPTNFSHALLVLPFLMLAMLLMLRRQPIWALALVGLSANLHAMDAFILAVPMLVLLLMNIRDWGWKRALISIGVLTVTALPVAIRQLCLPTQDYDLNQWVEILRARSYFHIFPFAMPLSHWASFFAFSAVAILTFVFSRSETSRENRKLLISFGISSVALILIGIVFTELYPLRPILELQPLRITMFLYLISVPLFIHPLAEGLIPGKRLSASLAGLGVILLLLAGNIVHFLIACALLFVWLIAHKLWREKNVFVNIAILLAAVILALGVLLPPAGRVIIDNPLLSLERLIVLSIASLVGLLFAFLLRKRTGLSESAKWLTLAGIFLGLLLSGLMVYKCFVHSPDPDWLAIQHRAKELIPQDKQVLVPPGLYGFRIESERAIFADWKDGTLGNFDPPLADEWWWRMQILGVSSAEEARELGETGYGELSAEQVQSLVEASGVNYIVALAGSLGEQELQGDVKELAREGKYSLYKVVPEQEQGE
jgi:hypothetical protein